MNVWNRTIIKDVCVRCECEVLSMLAVLWYVSEYSKQQFWVLPDVKSRSGS